MATNLLSTNATHEELLDIDELLQGGDNQVNSGPMHFGLRRSWSASRATGNWLHRLKGTRRHG